MNRMCVICRDQKKQGNLFLLNKMENYHEICAVLGLNPTKVPHYYKICDKHFTLLKPHRGQMKPYGRPTLLMEGYTIYKPSIAAVHTVVSKCQAGPAHSNPDADIDVGPSTSSAAAVRRNIEAQLHQDEADIDAGPSTSSAAAVRRNIEAQLHQDEADIDAGPSTSSAAAVRRNIEAQLHQDEADIDAGPSTSSAAAVRRNIEAQLHQDEADIDAGPSTSSAADVRRNPDAAGMNPQQMDSTTNISSTLWT
ncbi:uncharacterized protein LOC142233886 [Haematobia irritans]|uniref:uncharacterized protein LOC142233886 n=1 Tax=Haematobia irritans TaxID=7368 RepID=UPI003F5063BB